MKTNVKSFLTKLAFAVLFVAMIGLALVNVNFSAKSPVSAAEAPVFEISNGAYIKTVTQDVADKTAMRVKLTINQAYVDAYDVTGFKASIEMEGYEQEKVIDTANWLELIKANGTEVFNIDVANFRADQYDKNLTFYVYAITEGEDIAAENNQLMRSMEWTAAQAIVEGEKGLGVYVGNANATGSKITGIALETNKYAENTVVENTLKIDGLTSIDKAYLVNEKVNLTVSNGVVSGMNLANAKYAQVNNLTIISGSKIYVAEFKKVDFAIDSTADLKEFELVVKQSTVAKHASKVAEVTEGSKPVYAVLTASFDAAGTTFGTRPTQAEYEGWGFGKDLGGVFTGELDGQGYTIDNLKAGSNAMFWYLGGATIKNIGFTNAISNTSDGGFLNYMVEYNDNNYIQNVYIQLVRGNYEAGSKAAIGCKLVCAHVENVIVDVDFNLGGNYIVSCSDNTPSLKNVYAVSSNAVAIYRQNSGTSSKVNTGIALDTQGLSKIMNAGVVEQFTETGFWGVNNGIVYFKSAGIMLDEVVFGKNDTDTATLDFSKYGSNVTKVTMNGKEIAYTNTGAIVSIALADFGAVITSAGAANTFRVTAIVDGAEYTMPVVVADYAIDSATDFAAWLGAVNASADSTPVLYAVLTASFSCGKIPSSANLTTATFTGCLDGRGYTVSDMDLNGKGALFNDGKNAAIRNIAFTNAKTRTSGNNYLFTYSSSGKIYFTNIFVSFTSYAEGKNTGLRNIGTNSYLYNAIIYHSSSVAHSNTGGNLSRSQNSPITNVLYASNKLKLNSTSTDADTVLVDNYSNPNAYAKDGYFESILVSRINSGVMSAEGFKNNPCFKLVYNNNKLTSIGFISAPVEKSADNAIEFAKADYAKNKAEAYTLNLATYGVSAVDSVKVNGTAVEYTFANGVVSVANSELPNGLSASSVSTTHTFIDCDDVKVEIVTDNGTFLATLNVADYAIGSEAEFTAFLADVKDHSNFDTSKRRAEKNYNVYLTASFTMETAIAGDNGSFEGYFDGRGYTISGLDITSTDGKYGLFKFGGMVKFVNLGIQAKTNGYLLYGAMYCYQIIDNCYFEYETTAASNYGLFNGLNYCVMTNTILKANYTAVSDATVIKGTSLYAENVFAITNQPALGTTVGGANTAVYDSVDAFNAAVVAAKAEDATDIFSTFLSKYWKVTKDGNDQVTGLVWKSIPQSK